MEPPRYQREVDSRTYQTLDAMLSSETHSTDRAIIAICHATKMSCPARKAAARPVHMTHRKYWRTVTTARTERRHICHADASAVRLHSALPSSIASWSGCDASWMAFETQVS